MESDNGRTSRQEHLKNVLMSSYLDPPPPSPVSLLHLLNRKKKDKQRGEKGAVIAEGGSGLGANKDDNKALAFQITFIY